MSNNSLKGDFSVLHCASLLCTIFTSLAHANECVHVQNNRNLIQAKLNSKTNACFLNKHAW